MNKARIQFFGHSTILLTSETGKRILIDPWLDGNPSCPPHLLDPGHIDLLCLTHGHSDHASSAVEIAQKNHCPVVATYELLQLLVKEGINPVQMCPMNKGGRVKAIEGIHTCLTHALHSSSYDARDGITHYAGEPCGLVVQLESERCIYHAGDTALFGDMKFIGEIYSPTVALLPIGDRFTMGPREAAMALTLLKCPIAIPIHWGTFPLLSGTPEEFTKYSADLDCEIKILNPGEEFCF